MNKILNYFDLGANNKAPRLAVSPSNTTTAFLPWLPQYLALLCGVIVQPFLQNYMTTGKWDLQGLLILSNCFLI